MKSIFPFACSGHWYKGNLHMHTTQSDGQATPEEALAYYRAQGYDFVAITDHWVATQGRQVTDGFITIRGSELNGDGYHMVGLGMDALPPDGTETSLQDAVQFVNDQGGVAFFAHPYWMGQTSDELYQIEGSVGLEVYNSVCDRAYGLGYSAVQWDEMLARGKRVGGLAVDDTHWRYDEQGRGRIMLRAESLDEASILDALRQGSYYATTGPVIQDMRVLDLADGGLRLQVHCSPCQRITFYCETARGHRFNATPERPLTSAEYPIVKEMVYIRVECEDGNGGTAWSNPVYMADLLP